MAHRSAASAHQAVKTDAIKSWERPTRSSYSILLSDVSDSIAPRRRQSCLVMTAFFFLRQALKSWFSAAANYTKSMTSPVFFSWPWKLVLHQFGKVDAGCKWAAFPFSASIIRKKCILTATWDNVNVLLINSESIFMHRNVCVCGSGEV